MKYLFLLLVLGFVNCSYASHVIISDFDDTIKRSNIPNSGIKTVLNVPLYKKAYRGMPELLKSLQARSSGLYVLSASPKIISPFIRKTLRSFNIPYRGVFTRRFWEIGSDRKKINYKMKRINSVFSWFPYDSVILMGDNVEKDHTVYLDIAKKYPDRDISIYIRKVRNKNIPNEVEAFYSAFDIAAKEFQKNRLSFLQVEEIANKILRTSKEYMYRVIPHYAYCPTKVEEFNSIESLELKSLENLVQAKIIQSCKNRLK